MAEDEEAVLYEVVPEQFVTARDNLVRHLRAGGDKEGAARVAKLRRPPVTAWALNQVARTDPGVIESLLAAGADLRTAMTRAIGGDASGLRAAQGANRSAMETMVASAATRLANAGYPVTEATRRRMATTLQAATVDPVVAADLRAGVLAGDHNASGFGIDAVSVPLSASPPRTATTARAAEPIEVAIGEAAFVRRVAEVESSRREADARAAEAESSRREADALAAEAESSRREADALAAEADRLEFEARTVRARADDARRRADAADRAAAIALAEADGLAAGAGEQPGR